MGEGEKTALNSGFDSISSGVWLLSGETRYSLHGLGDLEEALIRLNSVKTAWSLTSNLRRRRRPNDAGLSQDRHERLRHRGDGRVGI